MGREWDSPFDAIAGGSLCTFQLEISLPSGLPLPGIPAIPIPDFPPATPTILLFCPFDEAEEERLE